MSESRPRRLCLEQDTKLQHAMLIVVSLSVFVVLFARHLEVACQISGRSLAFLAGTIC